MGKVDINKMHLAAVIAIKACQESHRGNYFCQRTQEPW